MCKNKNIHVGAFTKIVANNAIKDDNNSLTDILLEAKCAVKLSCLKDDNQMQIVEESNRMPYYIKINKKTWLHHPNLQCRNNNFYP